MPELYAYKKSTGNFYLFGSESQWESQMDEEAAKDYLRKHLRVSIANDYVAAEKAYLAEGGKIGFFGALRILFPSITFLGTLYKGQDDSRNAIAFMKEYLGKHDPRYCELSDLLYNMYRHGLMHTQMPKVLKIGSTYVGWTITWEKSRHLNALVDSRGVIHCNIPLCPSVFYEDLIKGLDSYIDDFNDKAKNLIMPFRKGFIEMSKIFTSSDKEIRNSPNGVAFIKRII